MQAETIRAAIGSAAETVLETMFFTMPESEAEPVFPLDTKVLRTAMTISGAWSGSFELNASVDSARTIAGNFLGEFDPAEVTDEQVSAVLCELANMICGSTLSHLDGEKIFDLGSPESSLVSGSGENQTVSSALGAAYGMNMGDGIITLALAVAETT